MHLLREWILRVRGTLRPGRRDGDLEEELRLHVEMAADAARRSGDDPRDATRAAAIRTGGTSLAMDALRDQRGLPWLDDFARDVRHALRSLCRTPGFTAAALLTLALGIGANAAIFTLIDAVLLKSLPVRDPGGLVLLGDARGSGVAIGQVGRSFILFSDDLYRHLEDADVLEGLAAFQSGDDTVRVRRTGWITPQPATARLVSGNYFQLLGVNAAVGRTIAPSDDSRPARPVAVVSYRYWKDTLNADASAIGETVDLNGVPVAIVGVAPPEFYGERIQPDPPSFWLPIAASRALNPEGHLVDEAGQHWLYLLGRLRPDDTMPQAAAGLTRARIQF
jgi:macrolide transport system ATP-binding/permease protein